MKILSFDLTNENVTLTAYIPDSSKEMPHLTKRRAILVIPGGAYKFCSDREAEPIAFKYLGKGYAAFILRYSLNENARFPKPLDDAVEALRLIRANASEWCIDPHKIAAIGFSAGGHLTAALATMADERPDAQILGYPCILEEIGKILAKPIPDIKNAVDSKTPPAFIFASAEDKTVPILNSLEYAKALDEKKIPFELHIFSQGYHGFSTAEPTVYTQEKDWRYNEDCAQWFDLCEKFLDRVFGIYNS